MAMVKCIFLKYSRSVPQRVRLEFVSVFSQRLIGLGRGCLAVPA